jgi:hypothetical protein
MKFSLSSSVGIAVLSLASLVGCAGNAETGSDLSTAQNETAAPGCVSYETAKATYDREVKAAHDKILADYAAAMDTYNQGVAAAKAEYNAVLASIPTGNNSANDTEILNAAVQAYNAKVAPDGPLVSAYNASVAAAKATYDRSTQAALDEYNTTICH